MERVDAGMGQAVGPGMNAPVMRPATRRDRGGMTASLCAAFADDPGLRWIWPDRDDRLARLPYFFQAILAGTMAQGVALCSGERAAVSLWRQPGRIHPGRWETLRGLRDMARAFRSGRERSQLLSQTLKAHQPRDGDWWYLQFIGVRPDAQGRGLGGAAIRAGLTRAGAAGRPVYVEVMNPDNLGYYRHVGFRTVAEFDIPDDGPHVWGMLWHG
ncbi:GNAT family N-acetyltransferase [Sphingobium sufflavum]|uniref:GNAT family N-acetyltransferase n=1 Tax=Sphingobium sufflavum TaxID=1129547 RepID=UPI001F492499|nr:GNAT family N-acetyltransferase [Sphingobium sufflavum]MCE7798445.1 GNAT family N-acetyltransferase [Sphingobium sufflavum]